MAGLNTVYRFKIGNEVSEILQRFAVIHMGDDIDDYQEAWDLFLEENNEVLHREHVRHQEKGFTGDFNHKIYISTRYYHRKKLGGETQGIQEIQPDAVPADADAHREDEEERQKRPYNKVDADVLTMIDQFLAQGAGLLKPSNAWEQFCTQHGDDACQKKTFKNRIYLYKRKQVTE